MEHELKKRNPYQELKRYFEKYERALIPGMLVFGVIVDFVTFRSIQITTAFTVLIVYVLIAGATIAFINAYDAEKITVKHRSLRYFRLASPLVIQFTFGALLSASLIFYWFSGTFSVSWPFIILIALLMTSNDVFRHYYLKPVVQMSVYFFILFSLSSLILPYVFNSISAWLFVSSGILSFVLIWLYVEFLSRSLPKIQHKRHRITGAVITIFIFMNALYFLNIIPPIPLALREAGVYHDITRVDGVYTLLIEEESILDRFLPGQTIHMLPGGKAAVYSAVFAPGELKTDIVHHWEYYDRETWDWISRGRFSFPIVGGREDGYRGFSVRTNLTPGVWRVNVQTKRGQVLGRVRFKVEHTDTLPKLHTISK